MLRALLVDLHHRGVPAGIVSLYLERGKTVRDFRLWGGLLLLIILFFLAVAGYINWIVINEITTRWVRALRKREAA